MTIEFKQTDTPILKPKKQAPAWLADVYPPTIVIGIAILVWHLLATQTGLTRFILPSPIDVIDAGWETRDLLWEAIQITLLETIIGLTAALLLGVGLAAAIDLSPFLRRALYPILVASQTVQILAIAPLLIIWFGFGLLPKILVVVLICFFPMAVSTADGLRSSDPEQVNLLRSMGATNSQIWRMVRLPAALPSFFSGLRIAVTYSIVGATIGEWVGGSGGLGVYLLRSKNALATDQVFVAMLITTILSIGLFAIVYLVERLMLPWYYATQRNL